MHRKRVFTIAAVFLVIALVVPPAFVVLEVNNTIYKYLIPGTSPVQGAPTISITNPDARNYAIVIIIAAIIEVIFIALFIFTLYIGINHTHPEH